MDFVDSCLFVLFSLSAIKIATVLIGIYSFVDYFNEFILSNIIWVLVLDICCCYVECVN